MDWRPEEPAYMEVSRGFSGAEIWLTTLPRKLDGSYTSVQQQKYDGRTKSLVSLSFPVNHSPVMVGLTDAYALSCCV